MSKTYDAEKMNEMLTGETEIDDETMAQMLNGEIDIDELLNGEGASEQGATTDETDEPGGSEPESEETVKPEPSEGEKPRVLTKDGKHTIPFEEYDGLRSSVSELTQKLTEQSKLIEDLKNSTPEPGRADDKPAGQEATMTDDELADLEDEFPEFVKMYRAQHAVIAKLQEQMEKFSSEADHAKAQTAEQAAWLEHMKAITGKHKNFNQVVEDGTLEAWVKTQPSFVQRVYESGSTDEVIEMMDLFSSSNKTAPPKQDSKSKVDEAIRKAESEDILPHSLTDIPGSMSTTHDTDQKYLDMEGGDLISKLLNMSEDKRNQMWEKFI